MSTASRIWLSLAVFLVIAGVVYGLTSHEVAGAALLLVGSAAFGYLAFVARRVVRRSKLEAGDSGAEEAVHVPPTIWPFGFALAGVILLVGFVVSPWLLVLGVLVFAISVGGWLRDVARAGHEGAGESSG